MKQLFLFPVLFLLCAMFSEGEKNHWFVKGTKLVYVVYDANDELKGRYEVEVTNVFSRNDTDFSESSSTWYDNGNEKVIGVGKLDFRRDSATFFGALANILPANVSYDGKTSIEIDGTPIVYPRYPKFDMVLPDASGTLKYDRESGKVETLYKLTKRVVMNRDTISGKFGDIPCWVVSSDESVEVLSIKQKKKPIVRTVKEWYSPEYGVVKTEYRTEGRLEQVRVLYAVN